MDARRKRGVKDPLDNARAMQKAQPPAGSPHRTLLRCKRTCGYGDAASFVRDLILCVSCKHALNGHPGLPQWEILRLLRSRAHSPR